jgi:hypothetical protein
VGVQGEKGEKGDPGPKGDIGLTGMQGMSGEIGERGPAGARGEIGPSGLQGEKGEAGAQGSKGDPGECGDPGPRGERGEPGPIGPQGQFPLAKAFREGEVHYASEVVIVAGATWQAKKDTGKAPPHEDWICLAHAGVDGVSPTVRGTYDPKEKYQRLDIVAFNKGSFIARKHDPGSCPGEDWQLITSYGKRGERGPPGVQGLKGDRGPPGDPALAIKSWKFFPAKYIVVPIMADGREGPQLELRSLFEQYNEERRG